MPQKMPCADNPSIKRYRLSELKRDVYEKLTELNLLTL
jgi:hypothetical protein